MPQSTNASEFRKPRKLNLKMGKFGAARIGYPKSPCAVLARNELLGGEFGGDLFGHFGRRLKRIEVLVGKGLA
jgi:hypothetical protein